MEHHKYETVLYSRDNCQWCERVKQLMDSVKFPYIEYKYGVDLTRKEFYAGPARHAAPTPASRRQDRVGLIENEGA